MHEDEINDFNQLLQQYNISGSVLKINLTAVDNEPMLVAGAVK